MFRRRRRKALQQALRGARDPQLRALQEEIVRRRERVAELELELFDTRADLARFEQELEARLGPLQQHLESLQAELRETRRRAALRAQWKDRDEPLVDVEEQFRRTWTPREPSAERPSPRPRDEGLQEQIKALYRELAKRFHPDLTTDPEEKAWRAGRMAQVNEAYAVGDLAALRRLAASPERPERAPQKTREQLMADMRAEIARLDRLIADLERQLDALVRSHTVQLMLDASIARRAGRDLLAEMAADLEAEIAQVEIELASLQ